MKVKEQNEKADSKQHSKNQDRGIQSHHFMANGETVGTVTVFILGGSKITVDDDYSHEIKTSLLFRRKAMTNLDSRAITLLTKVHLVKAMAFPVVMFVCESWTVKKVEC